MNIIMWIVIILGGILGIAVTLGTVAGMVGVIIYKICRKIRKKCRNIFIYYIKVFTDIFYIPVKAFVFYNIKNTS